MFAAGAVGGLLAGIGASAVAIVAAYTIPASWGYEVFGVTPLVVVGGVWVGTAVAMDRVGGDVRLSLWRLMGLVAGVGALTWAMATVVVPGVLADLVLAVAVPMVVAPLWVAGGR